MLGRLIKHEFRATGRIMGPLLLILLVLSLLANGSTRILEHGNETFLNVAAGITIAIYVVGIIAASVMAYVIMVQRFYKNLLGDEGYLMMTLPASTHSLIWSKLIVSLVWFAATGIAIALSVLLMVGSVEMLGELRYVFRELGRFLGQLGTGNVIGYALEALLLAAANGVSMCLMFYLALALGHSFANHKFLLSVVFFIALSVLSSTLLTYETMFLDRFLDGISIEITTAQQLTSIGHKTLLTLTTRQLLHSAVLYICTTLTLKRKLNLA